MDGGGASVQIQDKALSRFGAERRPDTAFNSIVREHCTFRTLMYIVWPLSAWTRKLSWPNSIKHA
jgi:hypothetical protein